MRTFLNYDYPLQKHGKVMFHCDIPCGIYDPHNAQLAAHTVLRMTDLLPQVKREDELKAEHDVARVTHVKEEHASILESELMTLKNDYFKDEHYKEFSDLEELIKKAVSLTAEARKSIDIKTCEDLLEAVLKISEIFYKTKGVEFRRVKSVYPTEREIVVQK